MSFSTAILFLFLILAVIPSDVAANKCVITGVYIRDNNTVLEPEAGILEEVGDKKCAFGRSGNEIKFMAVDIETKVDEFCTLWATYSICVCPFFGCNSLTGVYYETLFKSFYATKTGRVKGEKTDKSSDSKKGYKEKLIKRALMKVEDVYNIAHPPLTPAIILHKIDGTLESFRTNNSQMFPNEKRKQELIQEGIRLYQTTTEKTSTSKVNSSAGLMSPNNNIVLGASLLLITFLR